MGGLDIDGKYRVVVSRDRLTEELMTGVIDLSRLQTRLL
jgi:hypothetical protein